MKKTSDNFVFTVSLGTEAHRLAEQFRRYQKNAQKGKQVYLNTLAIYAVNFYLRCLGIAADWQGCDSYDPIMQTMMDVADLQVEDLGKLECRSLLPNAEFVQIPPEVWSDRIGYLVVEMNESLREAKLLGFVETVDTEELMVSKLRSLSEFPEYINQLRQPKTTNLRQWLDNIFTTGWQAVEDLISPQTTELALNFRNQNGVRRAKVLDLESAGDRVTLSIGVKPIDLGEMNIFVEVYPNNNQLYLPQDLQLMVLNAEAETVMEAVAKNTKNIQLEFSGELDERFSIKLALGDFSVTETFVI